MAYPGLNLRHSHFVVGNLYSLQDGQNSSGKPYAAEVPSAENVFACFKNLMHNENFKLIHIPFSCFQIYHENSAEILLLLLSPLRARLELTFLQFSFYSNTYQWTASKSFLSLTCQGHRRPMMLFCWRVRKIEYFR